MYCSLSCRVPEVGFISSNCYFGTHLMDLYFATCNRSYHGNSAECARVFACTRPTIQILRGGCYSRFGSKCGFTVQSWSVKSFSLKFNCCFNLVLRIGWQHCTNRATKKIENKFQKLPIKSHYTIFIKNFFFKFWLFYNYSRVSSTNPYQLNTGPIRLDHSNRTSYIWQLFC